MYWLILAVSIVGYTNAQLTAQTSVAPELRECYLDPLLLNRNNLPPTTMQVLIDIIQKIEDNPDVNMDLRQLSALLLHTYRQDGIEFHQPETTMVSSSNVLPYAPTFHSFHRHRLLLTRLIPSNLQVLGNTTLNSVLKCSLHHMLSTTVDARIRGDENMCSQLSQYRALRTLRSIDRDVEIIRPSKVKNTHGNMRQYNPKDDIEYTSYGEVEFEKQLGGSTCPLLDGVVSTNWGAVSAGNLIAGIAAGAQLQQVPILELAKGSVLNYNNVQQTVTSIYPATLSGDLAEAVLIQGTDRGSPSISIGAQGGWNSSQAHRHYLLTKNIDIEMSDPEIQGGIDGFILGSAVTTALSTFSSLRLSQLLDMYYNPLNGVFNSEIRACNRKTLRETYIQNDNLVSETYAFAAALDSNMPLRGTIIAGLQSLVTSAVTNFQSYTSNNLNTQTCLTSELTQQSRMKTNLYIVLDTSWQYQAIYPAISYLLDHIEVGKFGSSVTLLSALDGSIMINTTFSLADFHSQYTLAAHQSMSSGVNLQQSLTNIRIMMQESLNNETLRNYVGGNATVLLYMINTGNLQNNEVVFEQARLLNDTVPDLRVLFATSTNQFDNLWNLVRDMHNDIKTISLSTAGTNVELTMQPVLQRIQIAGRRIVNPLCGSTFAPDTTSGTRQFEDFVEPGFINFYRLSPNYFYVHHDNRKIRISRSSSGTGSLRICHSRSVAHPGLNFTVEVGTEENAVTCQTLAASGNVEIGLQNACDSYWTINTCPPLYVSVQSDATGVTTTSATCTDASVCRFPYNIRYQVQVEELGCFSGAGTMGASLAIVLIGYFFTLLYV